jgi:hypothetical protein
MGGGRWGGYLPLVLGGGVAVLGPGVATYGAFLFPLAVVGLLGFSLWRVRGSA